MDNTLQNAYKLVYDDIVNSGVGLFTGNFDSKNGNKNFMYGICTVMEFIAYNASEQDWKDFEEIWFKNFIKSLDR